MNGTYKQETEGPEGVGVKIGVRGLFLGSVCRIGVAWISDVLRNIPT